MFLSPFFEFPGQQHRLGDFPHGFSQVHALPLNQLERFLFRQLLGTHQIAFGPFKQLPDGQRLLHLERLFQQGRVLNGNGRLVGDRL